MGEGAVGACVGVGFWVLFALRFAQSWPRSRPVGGEVGEVLQPITDNAMSSSIICD